MGGQGGACIRVTYDGENCKSGDTEDGQQMPLKTPIPRGILTLGGCPVKWAGNFFSQEKSKEEKKTIN